MNNRNEIKWQPFNSLMNSYEVLKNLEKERTLKKLPILSDDEKEVLEKLLLKAFHTKVMVKVIYFWQNQYFSKLGFIMSLDTHTNKIYFKDNTSIYFE